MPSSVENSGSLSNDFSGARIALNTYRETCEELFNTIQNSINQLVQSGFVGDAAEGYVNYFMQVSPKISGKLTGDSDSVTSLMGELIALAEQIIILESS